MRDYGAVSPQFWTGDTGKKIRKAGRDAQVVALYLLTCPSSNMIGLYYLPLPILAHETGIASEGALEALGRLSEALFAHYDEAQEVVWVPEMARFQIGAELQVKDNRRLGVMREAEKFAKSPYYAAFLDRYRKPYNLPEPKPLPSPLVAPPKPGSGSGSGQDQVPPLPPKGAEEGGKPPAGETADPADETPADDAVTADGVAAILRTKTAQKLDVSALIDPRTLRQLNALVIDLATSDTPPNLAGYIALGDWIAANGLGWMRDRRPDVGYLLKPGIMARHLGEAVAWDRAGRPRITHAAARTAAPTTTPGERSRSPKYVDPSKLLRPAPSPPRPAPVAAIEPGKEPAS